MEEDQSEEISFEEDYSSSSIESISEQLPDHGGDKTEAQEYRRRLEISETLNELIKYGILSFALVFAILSYIRPDGRIINGENIILLMGFAFALLWISIYAQGYWKSKNTFNDRSFLKYSLTQAVEEVEEDPSRALYHLEGARFVFSKVAYSTFSDDRRENVEKYINTVLTTRNSEKVARETLPIVAKEILTEIEKADSDPIEETLKQIETEPSLQTSFVQQIRQDVSRMVKRELFSFWGLLGLSVGIGLTIWVQFDQPTAGTAVPTIVLMAYQIYQQQKD